MRRWNLTSPKEIYIAGTLHRCTKETHIAECRAREWTEKYDLLRTQYNERSVEFEALKRRFDAMFENGMTAEKQKEFLVMKSHLDNARAHTKEQYQKIQELEARVFELELTMGSVGNLQKRQAAPDGGGQSGL